MSCQVVTAAYLDSQELNPEDMEPKVGQWEDPAEEAAMKSSETMKK
jgi:hypothetical protein